MVIARTKMSEMPCFEKSDILHDSLKISPVIRAKLCFDEYGIQNCEMLKGERHKHKEMRRLITFSAKARLWHPLMIMKHQDHNPTRERKNYQRVEPA